jgi:hypothetical protein
MPAIRNPELGEIVTAYDHKGVLQHGVVVNNTVAGDEVGLVRWVEALFTHGIDVVYADHFDGWENKLISQQRHAHGLMSLTTMEKA